MAEQSTLARSGLFTTQALPVPLSGVSIAADISNFCARVSVTQRYVNRESSPIEAVYVFPLEEGAAVCGFEAIIDGTLVIGEVKERDEAFRMYDDAIERGDGAFLLDEERPDVFQASVGNLPPGKEVLLKLTYVAELAVADGALRFSLPTTVSPRYAPLQDRVGLGRPDSETLNPPVGWRVPYGLDLSIRLTMSGTISRIESPSHPVSVTVRGHMADVTLASRQAALDRDFVLSVEAEDLDTPQAWLERDDRGGQAIAVAFAPRLDHGAVPCDVTFLVDRSGSMQGTSIEEVRNALQLCLRSMIPGCCFNIVGFGSRFESLFPEGRGYDDTSLSAASAHVAGLDANLGGTEMLPALTFVLEQRGSQSMPRQVVVLTDGQVTNTDEVLALARKHSPHARIFTFGIGAGASHHLVSGLARAGGGTAEFIYPGERIEPKVVRHFGRLLSPALTNVRMTWGELDVTQTPSVVPPVFAGGRLLLYALVKDVKATTLSLSAVAPSGPVTFELPLDPLAVSPGATVGTLAARARIRELEESPAWTSARGSRQQGRKQTSVTQEIVSLSMQYGLMSRETSFVAVERRETPVTGDVQLRRVPVALTTGWGGLDQSAMPRSLTAASFGQGSFDDGDALASLKSRAVASLSVAAPSSPSRLSRLFRVFGSGSAMADEGASYSVGVTATSPLHKIVALQRANGSWELTRELAEAIGFDLSRLEAALPDTDVKPAQARRAWATALALAWLRAHAADAEDQWRLLAAKARAWLDAVGSVPSDGRAWIEAAATFLSVP
jgi:Ca-activated chloride channel family protein